MPENNDLAIQEIQAYWQRTYPDRPLPASPAEIEQLSWVSSSLYQTNEGALAKKPPEQKPIHIEVPRALARLHCLNLLKTGDAQSYEAFIEAQRNTLQENQILSRPAFQTLSEDIQKLDQDAYEALRVSTLLMSVTLSPPAKVIAQQRLGAYPIDSVEFVATTVEKAPDMYPLVKGLSAKSIEYLQAACAHHTHFRHMMYMEGGLGMFRVLQEKLSADTLSKEDFHVWYCHWMINITGFRAQTNPHGSLYLSQVTYQDMRILADILKHYCFNSTKPIEARFGAALEEYSNKRAGMLGLRDSNKLVLARLGALLRLHTFDEGRALAEGFAALDPNLQATIIEQYQRTFEQDELTPTYSPAFFANFMAATENDIQHTVRMCLPIYMDAFVAYRNALTEGRISPETPLNFNGLASKKTIEQLLAIDAPAAMVVELKIAASGLVEIEVIRPRVETEVLLKAPMAEEASAPTNTDDIRSHLTVGGGALALAMMGMFYLYKQKRHAMQNPTPANTARAQDPNNLNPKNPLSPFNHPQRRSLSTTPMRPYHPAFDSSVARHSLVPYHPSAPIESGILSALKKRFK